MVVSRRTALPHPPPAGLSDGDDTTTGVTITRDVLAAEIHVTEQRAGRLLDVATEMVSQYAPDAPTAILNEAVIRVCGYLAQQPSDARRESTTGGISTGWAPTHTSALRHSGAMSLLSPWKIRRAGAIG